MRLTQSPASRRTGSLRRSVRRIAAAILLSSVAMTPVFAGTPNVQNQNLRITPAVEVARKARGAVVNIHSERKQRARRWEMSRTEANTEKTAGTLKNAARPDNLHWDVFVTPGIPIVTRNLPPGIKEAYFQAMASTLIYGVRDAVLVAHHVRDATAALDELIGTVDVEDVLDRVFANFCVGK